jgi:dihydroorotase
MLKVLYLFSDPPGVSKDLLGSDYRLRLDKEDRIVSTLARRFPNAVHVHRQHASETEDIHKLLNDSAYDVITSVRGINRINSIAWRMRPHDFCNPALRRP